LKGLLLAGGHGTRLRPLTYTGNKHMLPIANEPMLFYGLKHLRDAGIREIGIVLGPIKEGVKEAMGDGSSFGVRVTYIEQKEPRGIAHAVMVSREFLEEEPFVMYLGDNLLKNGIRELMKEFENPAYEAVIALCRVEDPTRFGVVELDHGRVVRLVEKPKEPKTNLALVGVYLFRRAIFSALETIKPSWRNEYEITDAIQVLVDDGYNVHPHMVSGWWKDTGTVSDLLEANQLVLSDLEAVNSGKAEDNVLLTGKVSIGGGTTVRTGSTIRGPAIVGCNCDIGPRTYIGPYTSIGDRVVIRGGEVENSIVMSDVFIDSGKRIVDSLIGKASRITSQDGNIPKGCKFVIGENTIISV